VIINQTLAQRFWANDHPTGWRIRLREDAPWLEVVGVVADIKNRGLEVDTKPEMFFPYAESPFGLGPPPRAMTLVVRTASDPQQSIPAIRSEIGAMDSELPVDKVRTMEQIIAASVSRLRFTMLLLSSFAGLALILAAVGIYGVMSYSVASRTHEIGIRRALGARPHDVFKLVIGQGFVLALVGIAGGLVGAFALTRVMSSLLFRVSPTDPWTFVGISLMLMGVALLACYVPARRAIKVYPMIALRYE
jgi:predicted permease